MKINSVNSIVVCFGHVYDGLNQQSLIDLTVVLEVGRDKIKPGDQYRLNMDELVFIISN